MNRKIILLALAAISAAAFALPAAASANPALHISGTPSFTVASAIAGTFTRADNNNISCTSISGGGKFTTTTTGALTLTFHGCKSTALGVHCQSGATTGTITTTELEFHLVTVTTPVEAPPSGVKGILITANALHFASANCVGVPYIIFGDLLGEITAPNCGASSSTATLNFASASAGVQKHTKFTGVRHDLFSEVAGNEGTASLDAEATISFAGGSQTLTCT